MGAGRLSRACAKRPPRAALCGAAACLLLTGCAGLRPVSTVHRGGEPSAYVDRSQAYLHYCLGVFREKEDDPDGAAEEYAAALGFDPGAASVHLRLG